MVHSGNKTQKTINSEEIFIAVMRTLGLNVFYEHTFHNTFTAYRKIDFVVGFPYTQNGICYNGMVGVELKTREADIKNPLDTGKSFRSFPFNYILVTEDIVNSAIKFVGENENNSHIGILVIQDDCSVQIYKPAEFCGFNSEYYNDLKKDIDYHQYEKYRDSISCSFAKFGLYNSGSVHNFRTGNTSKIKYELFSNEIMINGVFDCLTGTTIKKTKTHKNRCSA